MRIWKIIFIMLIFPAGCKPDKQPDKQPEESGNPIVWKYKRSRVGLTSTNHIYKNTLIQGTIANMESFGVVALDLITGEKIWENTDFPHGFEPFDIEHCQLSGNKLVISYKNDIFCINADNGKTLWSSELTHGNSNIAIIDGWIYKSNEFTKYYSELFRYDLQTGSREKLFRVDKTEHDDYGPDLCSPVKWNHPGGDNILILQNRSYNWGASKQRMDILAYNLTADSIFWYREGLDESSSVSGPAISGDKVYFFGMFSAYCINPESGKTLWKFTTSPDDYEGDFNTANILIVDDNLIVKPDSRWIYAVNKETGKLIWTNKETRAMPYLLREHNDTIWLSSGGVLAIDANTGEKLIDWYEGGGSWIFPVACHPTNGNIYTCNEYYIYCFDPDRMK